MERRSAPRHPCEADRGARGYYRDFGSTSEIKRALEHGFVYTGQYSGERQRSHGALPQSVHPWQFVVCSQNHDQVGNRAVGDRLTDTLDVDQLKLAAATILLSPFTPMLFMGEEYGETHPFQYFTSHGDPDLIEAVRKGRTEEFKAFGWSGDVPDPNELSTFQRSKLDVTERESQRGRQIEEFYRDLIRLRRENPALRHPEFSNIDAELASSDDSVVVLESEHGGHQVAIFLNYAQEPRDVAAPPGSWRVVLDSAKAANAVKANSSSSRDSYRAGDALHIAGSSVVMLERCSEVTA